MSPQTTAETAAAREGIGRAPSVHIQAARLDYAGMVVFDSLDLTLPGGETTCLLGPSGVGKTSLLRLIAGLNDSAGSRGTVLGDDGRPVHDRIAYLAQQDLLLPWLSVLGNVVLGYRLRGQPITPAVAERARTLIARVGLAGREGDRPARLSGGMRQRVALARTLMEERPVVLMDEPFSALDAITRFELQALAAELLQARTVLLVTHDPLEALRLGHRVLIMAGAPARIEAPLIPPGSPPRAPGDPAILRLLADLLARLSAARSVPGEIS
ncbi:MAG: ABC transporter ATP-binding protein [Alphaproteobacteria bacterium]|nr:MAG: ABC transporter ATP-binding protein [Alphaproteobacteria bacterium]